MGIGIRLETVGKQMERNWRICEGWMELDGTAVMRGSAGNARMMGQMVYAICFSF